MLASSKDLLCLTKIFRVNMGLRSPYTQGLRNACREIAEHNWGFVYANESDVQDKINEVYTESDGIGILDASEVAENQIKDALNGLVERDEAERCREGVYFINPFGRREWDKETLITRLEEAFTKTPFVTEEQLKEKLDNNEVSISDDDLSFLIAELKDRGYVESGFSSPTHTYYKPGDSLTGHRLADLPPLSERLKDVASDGVVTRNKLQSTLGIKVDDRIITELKAQDAILNLGAEESGPYLIDEESCLKEHVESLIDRGFIREIETSLEDANYVLKRSKFEDELLDLIDERSNVLNAISRSDRESTIEHAGRVVKQRCGFTIETEPIDGVDEQCLTCAEELDSFFDQKARERIRTEADGATPEADRPFIENEVIPSVETQSYSRNGESAIDGFFRDRIAERCRTIPQNELLEQVIDGGR